MATLLTATRLSGGKGTSTAVDPTRRALARLGNAAVRGARGATKRSVRFHETTMARMHTRRRGQSGSDRPVTDEPPEWSDVDADAVEERVVELAEAGHSQSEIGLKLRDEGIDGTPVPDVTLATGKKIGEILAEHDAGPELPDDLRHLLQKAVRLNEHMDEHGQDHQNKRALQNAESKVRRLVNYYRGDALPADFTYTYETAKDLLE